MPTCSASAAAIVIENGSMAARRRLLSSKSTSSMRVCFSFPLYASWSSTYASSTLAPEIASTCRAPSSGAYPTGPLKVNSVANPSAGHETRAMTAVHSRDRRSTQPGVKRYALGISSHTTSPSVSAQKRYRGSSIF